MSQTPSINGSHMLGFARRTAEELVILPAVEFVVRTNRTAIRVAPAMKANILKNAEDRRATSHIFLNPETSNLHNVCRDYLSRTAGCSERVFYQTNPLFQTAPWKSTKTLRAQGGRKRPNSFFTKRSHSNPWALGGFVIRPAALLNYETNPLGRPKSEPYVRTASGIRVYNDFTKRTHSAKRSYPPPCVPWPSSSPGNCQTNPCAKSTHFFTGATREVRRRRTEFFAKRTHSPNCHCIKRDNETTSKRWLLKIYRTNPSSLCALLPA
jgi:hypothetical protein